MSKVLSDKKVILGLSGGVDSTAAALSLKDKGYDVIGLYFDVEKNNHRGIQKVKKVAYELGIEIIIKNVNQEFEKKVINEFIKEYSEGRTPNPCILCNPLIKFKMLIETADKIGAKYIATGHYARIEYSDIQDCHVLKKPMNIKKDQSYMLHRLSSEYLSRLLLPLADIQDKEETRDIARKNHMSNANDEESQEICFINNDETYVDFLKKKQVSLKKGNFIDKKGIIIGQHDGILNYTIGQRKGLGIAVGKPAFVVHINNKNHDVVIGDNEDLFSDKTMCDNLFFTSTNSSDIPKFLYNKNVMCKIRYGAKPAEAKLEKNSRGVQIIFYEKQRAIAPGQWIVMYYENEVVGGGRII